MSDAISLSVQIADAPVTKQVRLRSIIAGSIGNLVEWYDFYVYTSFSLYFARAFFPDVSPTAQLLNSAGIYALGFLIRPLGGWAMGIYADRKGRKAALLLSVMMMCFGSLIIACCPTYAQAGSFASLILLLARLLQGFSLGAEYGTTAAYLAEISPPNRRGFYTSFQYVTLIAGLLLATIVLLTLQRVLLTPAELEAWGWRIPFFIGAGLAVVGLYMRRGLAESEAFQSAAAKLSTSKPMRELIRHPREVGLVVGLTAGGTVAFYTYATYMLKFLVNTVGLPRDQATLISVATLFFYMCLQPVFGALSDHIGRRPLLIFFGVAGTVCTWPLLTLLTQTHDSWMAFALIMSALVIVSGYTSINAVVKAELFPVGVRALGVGLPYAVTVSVFGGSAEYVALWLKGAGHETWFFWYVTACIFASLMVYTLMRDTRRDSALEDGEHASS